MLKVTIALIIWLHIRETVAQEAFKCGVPHAQKAALVLNGEDAERNEWPWHVALFRRSKDSISYICGGTLISDQFVLTAAHCVFNKDTGVVLTPGHLTTHVGRHNIKKYDMETYQEFDVAMIHTYSNFTLKSLRDDIALLQLSTSVKFNEYVQPACVDQEQNLAGENGTTVGWGLTENDVLAEVLQKVKMPVIDDTKCLASDRDFFRQIIAENVFCAGYTNGTGVCNGDSGGGMIFQRDGVWYVGGIVSHSKSRTLGSKMCSLDGYGIFTRVQKYIPWIERKTKLSFLQGKVTVLDGEYRFKAFPECMTGKEDLKKKTSSLLPKFCGKQTKSQYRNSTRAGAFEFPWMAQVFDHTGRFCVGSLISKRYVLTFASCPILFRDSLKVRLGEHTIGQTEDCNTEGECAPPVQDYGIQCLKYHPDSNSFTSYNDILLIRLDKDVAVGNRIQPVCLPTTAALRQMEPTSGYIISGWELEHMKDVRPLRKRTIQHRNISECEKWTNDSPEILLTSKICVQSDKIYNKCIGDYGAPVGFEVQNKFVQFALATASYGCGRYPRSFLKVASFMDWIVANIEA